MKVSGATLSCSIPWHVVCQYSTHDDDDDNDDDDDKKRKKTISLV